MRRMGKDEESRRTKQEKREAYAAVFELGDARNLRKAVYEMAVDGVNFEEGRQGKPRSRQVLTQTAVRLRVLLLQMERQDVGERQRKTEEDGQGGTGRGRRHKEED